MEDLVRLGVIDHTAVLVGLLLVNFGGEYCCLSRVFAVRHKHVEKREAGRNVYVSWSLRSAFSFDRQRELTGIQDVEGLGLSSEYLVLEVVVASSRAQTLVLSQIPVVLVFLKSPDTHM